jgi:hypothetical protein
MISLMIIYFIMLVNKNPTLRYFIADRQKGEWAVMPIPLNAAKTINPERLSKIWKM